MIRFFAIFLLTLFSQSSIRAKYSSIDPKNAAQNFAFYELYPDTDLGKMALQRAWSLFSEEGDPTLSQPFSKVSIQALIKAINRENSTEIDFSEEELELIERLGKNLKNRPLKGRASTSSNEVKSLETEEIDLARAVFLEEYQEKKRIRSYEALIDLMALQVLAKLPSSYKDEEMIDAINDLVFYEMGFRFPSQSSWKKEIDQYTVLPSVIDSKRGVCLGVSILYLAIAQRLGLNLEAVTPPGHIYIRHQTPEKTINIETTARGIHIPSKRYKTLEETELKTRTLKEVVGLVFVNQASVEWMKKKYEKAISFYQKALEYLPNDPLVNELLAYNYLFSGKIEKGKALLLTAQKNRTKKPFSQNLVAEDYINGETSIEGIQAIFSETEESKTSILEKQSSLKKILKDYPKFRAGLLSLSLCYLQRGQEKNALDPLEKLIKIDPDNATALYYLAMIYLNRYDYVRCRLCINQLIKHFPEEKPKVLKELIQSLEKVYPTSPSTKL